ncbi:hypothetical protein [Mangrovicoccus ximenensis]|uniref:hypothetical protein n=1 Tax=Mangrovicoccus ximenensis TaxID=1911570 RepID=UPI000D356AA3|nr:hypothetical protein [Mangrovicoccus ximenensis]
MNDDHVRLLDWLCFRRCPDLGKARWLGGLIGALLFGLALFLAAMVLTIIGLIWALLRKSAEDKALHQN